MTTYFPDWQKSATSAQNVSHSCGAQMYQTDTNQMLVFVAGKSMQEFRFAASGAYTMSVLLCLVVLITILLGLYSIYYGLFVSSRRRTIKN